MTTPQILYYYSYYSDRCFYHDNHSHDCRAVYTFASLSMYWTHLRVAAIAAVSVWTNGATGGDLGRFSTVVSTSFQITSKSGVPRGPKLTERTTKWVREYSERRGDELCGWLGCRWQLSIKTLAQARKRQFISYPACPYVWSNWEGNVSTFYSRFPRPYADW